MRKFHKNPSEGRDTLECVEFYQISGSEKEKVKAIWVGLECVQLTTNEVHRATTRLATYANEIGATKWGLNSLTHSPSLSPHSSYEGVRAQLRQGKCALINHWTPRKKIVSTFFLIRLLNQHRLAMDMRPFCVELHTSVNWKFMSKSECTCFIERDHHLSNLVEKSTFDIVRSSSSSLKLCVHVNTSTCSGAARWKDIISCGFSCWALIASSALSRVWNSVIKHILCCQA